MDTRSNQPAGTSFSQLKYVLDGGVARVTLNRPDRLNAFTPTLYRELRSAVRLANADARVDVIVLTGAGRAFATGGDLGEVLSRLRDPDPLALYEFEDALPFDTIRQSPKTTIAAVNGTCVAGGLDVAIMCDIQVATESATFGIPEARSGLSSSYIPSLMYARVSLSKLAYLIYTGKSISATEAERIGMITEVVADGTLGARVDEVVAEVRRTSPIARAQYKEYLNRLAPEGSAADLYRGLRSPDVVEKLESFAQRRRDAT